MLPFCAAFFGQLKSRMSPFSVPGARYTARLDLCERFALPVSRHGASLEAEAAG